MKNSIKYFGIALMMAMGFQTQAQDVDIEKQSIWDRDLPNFRAPDQRGINDFEPTKDTYTNFDGVQVRLGGASTIQLQGLSQENASGAPALHDLGTNFNLATANLVLDVLLADGMRMHLTTYLSSLHHTEAYVKGGYIQIDGLDWISKDLSGVMDNWRVKIGHMENNYGDAHFRRSDNAQAIYNPFVGNYLMDSFTTEVGAEVYYFNGPWLAMAGFTNSTINQSSLATDRDPSYLAKIGFDKQINEDFRFRLTGSVFHSGFRPNSSRGSTQYLYSGDRAGTRYYNVMQGNVEGVRYDTDFRAGRLNPNFGEELTAFMINPFIKVGGLEFFGIYENASGSDDETWNHYSGELIYRFGATEDFYLGTRYNTANNDDVSVNRFNVGGGWFMTKNVLAKIEYINQQYNDYPTGTYRDDANFNGFNIEAVISF
ncbi:hypothetical protein LB467_00165 [Salegentibacter sp. JZCK2]|uniref:hypothetical protein n=1 Tax=Salegentibacter tibetensis TaxID=2873600 RepID=UPI001CCAF827|nr:hypothetical protein [Salegentibacter tibetensis]MBZ9728090.1 hypothetical protein [Salegentibacter tibetensis]